jgi:hypothetical protein
MGLSVADLINKWSPPTAPGNSSKATQDYINFVSGQLGVPASTPIGLAEKKTPNDGANTTSGSSTPGILSQINSAVFEAINGRKPGQTTAEATGQPGAFTFARIGAFILGFIFIAGGLYLFKPVQNVVNESVRGSAIAAA